MRIVGVKFWLMPSSHVWAYAVQAVGPGRWDCETSVHTATGFDTFADAARDAVRIEEQIRTGQLVPSSEQQPTNA
jgi:hypothetical protein